MSLSTCSLKDTTMIATYRYSEVAASHAHRWFGMTGFDLEASHFGPSNVMMHPRYIHDWEVDAFKHLENFGIGLGGSV